MQYMSVLGHPTGHSKSPAIHNAVFAKLGLTDWEYGYTDLPTPEDAAAYIQSREYLGMNITTPYKPVAFENVDVMAATAKLAGGVNLIVNVKDKLLGYNVDGTGLCSYLVHQGFDFTGKKVVVTGTGPTSLSVLHACAMAGAGSVALIGRDRDRAKATMERYLDTFGRLVDTAVDMLAGQPKQRSFRETYEQTEFKFGSYDTSRETIAEADFITDATILGMKPDDPAAFDTSLLSAGQTVCDTVYRAKPTQLLADAAAAGCTWYDGTAMLLGQAYICQQSWLDAGGVTERLSWEESIALMRAALNQ